LGEGASRGLAGDRLCDHYDDNDAERAVKCFAVLLLGVAILAGCGERKLAPASSAVIWAAPQGHVRFVSYNTLKSSRGRDRILADVRTLCPDFARGASGGEGRAEGFFSISVTAAFRLRRRRRA